ncbi:MAG: HTH-type transcriptional regulator YofA [Pseudomonadota bacterium]|jgi:DNA-binding transcriptional LysR family regulator
MTPSPDDLAYFLEAARKLNFSRAAEALGISQPSLSLAIRRVEHELGHDLFIRSKRGVVLTQAGKQLFAQTQKLLDTWLQIRNRATASEIAMEGCYTIGCHPSVALYSLPTFLPRVLAKHSKIEIQLVHDLSRRIAEGVIASRIDIGIVINPIPHPDLVIKKIAKDEFTIWSSDTKSSIDQIKNGGTIICASALGQTQHILNQLRNIVLVSPRVIESESLEVVSELASHGCGLGILPSRVANRSNKKLFQIRNAPRYQDEICVILRADNRSNFAMRELVTEIQKGFTSL